MGHLAIGLSSDRPSRTRSTEARPIFDGPAPSPQCSCRPSSWRPPCRRSGRRAAVLASDKGRFLVLPHLSDAPPPNRSGPMRGSGPPKRQAEFPALATRRDRMSLRFSQGRRRWLRMPGRRPRPLQFERPSDRCRTHAPPSRAATERMALRDRCAARRPNRDADPPRLAPPRRTVGPRRRTKGFDRLPFRCSR